ncbi:UNVERIFIED_CONTAM: hypothetical protein RMT77_002829 [Armadillidium vulgare]
MTFNSLHCSISTKLNNMSLELAYFGHDKGSENFKIDTYCQEIIEYKEGNYQWSRNNYAFDDPAPLKYHNISMNKTENNFLRRPSLFECDKFSLNSCPMKKSNKRLAYPLEGCLCDVCSKYKNFQSCFVRKGPCIPKDSIVVLKGSNRIGKYLYFGHRKMVEEEMSCEWNCLTPREVGYNIKLLYPEDTEIFIQCELIEAVYFPSEKNDHEEASGVKIHQYTSLPLIHNPLPSEHFNLYRSEIYRRSNSMYGSSGNRHPAYSGYRSLSENSFYPDCRDPYLDSDDSVFGYSNGSRHFVSNNFVTDV